MVGIELHKIDIILSLLIDGLTFNHDKGDLKLRGFRGEQVNQKYFKYKFFYLKLINLPGAVDRVPELVPDLE